jgi:hypothetical protein
VSLRYAHEKMTKTVDHLAVASSDPRRRLVDAWVDQGNRALPPGSRIPSQVAVQLEDIAEKMTGAGSYEDSVAAMSDDEVMALISRIVSATFDLCETVGRDGFDEP